MTLIRLHGLPQPPTSLRVTLGHECVIVRVPANPLARLFVGFTAALSAATWVLGVVQGGAWPLVLLWSLLPLALGAVAVPRAIPSTLSIATDHGRYRSWSWSGPSGVSFPWRNVAEIAVRPSRTGQAEHDPDEPGHVEIRFQPRTLPGPLCLADGRPDEELVWIGILIERAWQDFRESGEGIGRPHSNGGVE